MCHRSLTRCTCAFINTHANTVSGVLMAPKRAAAGDADAGTVEEHKHFKSAMAEAAEDFVCPITHELPVHPVMAEDGHIYERSEIEKWIRVSAQEGRALKSPTTNEEMGDRLTRRCACAPTSGGWSRAARSRATRRRRGRRR